MMNHHRKCTSNVGNPGTSLLISKVVQEDLDVTVIEVQPNGGRITIFTT